MDITFAYLISVMSFNAFCILLFPYSIDVLNISVS